MNKLHCGIMTFIQILQNLWPPVNTVRVVVQKILILSSLLFYRSNASQAVERAKIAVSFPCYASSIREHGKVQIVWKPKADNADSFVTFFWNFNPEFLFWTNLKLFPKCFQNLMQPETCLSVFNLSVFAALSSNAFLWEGYPGASNFSIQV